MSEYSAAGIANSDWAEAIQLYLDVYPINDNWVGLLVADEYLAERDTLELLNSISITIPILYLYNSEDYGWGFKVFNGGRGVAEFMCTYETEEDINIKLDGITPEIFQLFKLDRERSTELVTLLDKGEVSQDLIINFKDILGIPEFIWMSYSYRIDDYMQQL